MDNLCHTLTGAAMAQAGLKRRTRYAGAALMLSANLPDLDVLVFATSVPAVAFRRGWTHGLPAQLILPVLLTVAILLVARVRPPRTDAPPVSGPWLLGLSYLGVLSHAVLDFLNTYGVRLLAPIDWRWFYGDSVFIIDPWLWLMLGGGVWLARRRGSPAIARRALVVAGGYIVAMLLSTLAARDTVTTAWREREGTAPRALMVGPVPAWPFSREVIVDAGEHYRVGRLTWWPAAVAFDPHTIPKNAHAPEVRQAIAQSADVRGFLVWSRFPFWEITPIAQGTRVTVTDARFMATRVRFSASTVVAREAGPPD